MRWLLIIIPILFLEVVDDQLVTSIGLLIVSTAILIYRYHVFTETKMKDSIQAAIDTKPALTAAIGGGALTFTATNIISVVGLVVGVAGLVIAVMQWRENKRRNDLVEKELEWKMNKD